MNLDMNDVKIGDVVDFKNKNNRATSRVKDVNYENRLVKINYFEDPDLVIDRVDKWVSFELLNLIKRV